MTLAEQRVRRIAELESANAVLQAENERLAQKHAELSVLGIQAIDELHAENARLRAALSDVLAQTMLNSCPICCKVANIASAAVVQPPAAAELTGKLTNGMTKPASDRIFCRLAGPGRGDCQNAAPISITTKFDEYGIPTDWCEYCWLKLTLAEIMQELHKFAENYGGKEYADKLCRMN